MIKIHLGSYFLFCSVILDICLLGKKKKNFTSHFSFCFDPSSGPNPMFVIA